MLFGATSLRESDFCDAYLLYADFTGASLQGSQVRRRLHGRRVLANADLTPAQQGTIPASLYAAG
jgi:uncharacterized protein YjbI with pentapeptide repeats